MAALPQGFWYDTIDSTQEEARRLVRAGKIHGTAFVLANHQTDGRGTQGREWSSPEGKGIYLSVVHRAPQDEPFELTPIYTLSAGVACAEALCRVVGIDVDLKPINDLYVNGRKLGGILVESDVSSGAITTLMTGVGLNLYDAEHHLDRQGVEPVSLQEILSPPAFSALSPDALVETLVTQICAWTERAFAGDHPLIQAAWQERRLSEVPLPDEVAAFFRQLEAARQE